VNSLKYSAPRLASGPPEKSMLLLDTGYVVHQSSLRNVLPRVSL